MKTPFLLIAIILPTSSLAADEPPDGKQILEKMAHAMHSLNYQGTVAFVRGGKLDTMAYYHATQNNIEQERMSSLNSPLREITRQSGRVSHLYPATGIHMTEERPFEDSFLLNIPKRIGELEAYYSVNVLDDDEKVALLPAYAIELKPKDQLRYSRKIWIEKNNSLPVRTETFDVTGQQVEEMSFTKLEIKDKLPILNAMEQWHGLAEDKRICAYKTKIVDFATAPFTADQLPPGFHVLFFTQRTLKPSDQPVNHLIIGDGLSFVSIYLEHSQSNTANYQSNGVQTIGSVRFYSQPLDNYDLTVMGEVPEETISLIANSIKLKTDKH